MPSINEAFPSRFLKVDDLQGREIVLTIADVQFEELGQDREKKLVMSFRKTDKVLPLNKTNSQILVELLGSDDTDEWVGANITLYPTMATAFGERKKVIRVKDQLPTQAAKAKAQAKPDPMPEPAWAEDVAAEMPDPTDPDNDIPF